VIVNIIKSRTGPASHIVGLRHTLSGQQSSSHKKGNITDGNNYEVAAPSLFQFRGPSQVQEVLFRGGEDLLCSRHECKEALTLFQGPHHKSTNKSAIGRHLQQ
jgi:hypothetical protein